MVVNLLVLIFKITLNSNQINKIVIRFMCRKKHCSIYEINSGVFFHHFNFVCVNLLFFNLDSSPYPGSCPCPIQSFPKNVHIGPLIGSKTDKGPCQKNSTHLHETALNPIQFKTENTSKNGTLDVVVKPEIIDTHTQYDTIDGGGRNHKNIDSINRSYEKIGLVPQHHPNYTLNPKLLEQPEMSISPARGSIGPGIPKIQAGATQPIDVSSEKTMPNSLNSIQNRTPATGRRARVGKNMAREMMLQSHPSINDSVHEMEMDLQGDSLNESKSNICSSTPIKEQKHNADYEKNHTNTPHFMFASKPINGKLIKQEDVKKECDDDVLVISDKSETETISSDTEKSNGIQIIDLSSDNGIRNHTGDDSNECSLLKRRHDNSSSDEIIDLDEDVSVTNVKRRKILEFHKKPTKKSSPNSYKSLIKPSETKSYLCRAESVPKDKDQATDCSTPITAEDSMDSLANGFNEHDLLKISCRDVDCSDVNRIGSSENRTESIGKTMDTISLTPSIGDEFPHELSAEEESFMSHLDSINEGISKGYCSDNEVLSRKKERIKNKLQKCEGRSRSESKKCDKISVAKLPTKSDKSTPKSRKTSRDRSTSSSKSKERTEKLPAKKPKLSENTTVDKVAAKKKTESKTKKEKSKTSKPQKSCDKTKKTPDNRPTNADADSDTDSEADADHALLDNEPHHNNNNNSCLLDKNNKLHLGALNASTVSLNKTLAGKKLKSRGCKFSNKKKHRSRHTKHIEEIIIPRQTQIAPRWSNGWTWLGEPFQGKVFLNVSSSRFLLSLHSYRTAEFDF